MLLTVDTRWQHGARLNSMKKQQWAEQNVAVNVQQTPEGEG